ncbi:MAG TPA: SDR family oxidoreductase [Jatrophihabitans sp.]|nr:SDR family oxidoreductase [Jatrophihabitans sp.]
MDLGLSGRVALVAGATSGLGLAVATALAAEGAHVAICGRRADVAADQAAGLATAAAPAIGVALDLTDPQSISRAVEEVRSQLGEIDVLVLNGGGPPPSDAASLRPADGQAAAKVLLDGPVQLVGECLPGMRSRSWGRIVAVGSSAVQQPIPGLATSSMYRTALASYLKLLSREVAGDGVTVNMVLPGRIDTARVGQLDANRAHNTGKDIDTVRAESQATIPVGRYGTVEEFAAVVAFVCGRPASYVTGAQVRVDGGLVNGL